MLSFECGVVMAGLRRGRPELGKLLPCVTVEVRRCTKSVLRPWTHDHDSVHSNPLGSCRSESLSIHKSLVRKSV